MAHRTLSKKYGDVDNYASTMQLALLFSLLEENQPVQGIAR
jgi:hypothetical protein